MRIACVGMILMGMAGLRAFGCDTAVHRYALENWLPDVYPLVLLHRGPLDGPVQKLAKELNAKYENGVANIGFVAVDVEGTTATEPLKGIVTKFGAGELPRLVLLGPQSADAKDTLWDGPAEPAAAAALLDSPARREVARRLIEERHAAVWVLLESGERKADDDAAETLAKILADAPAALAEAGLLAPASEEESGTTDQENAPTTATHFSLLRVSRQDAKEQFFVRMLMGADPALRDSNEKPEPVTFPIFGRGRALGALAGENITRDNILQGCAVLAGPCACEIKAQNPGVDMLFSVDWTNAFEDGAPTPDIPSIASVQPLPAALETTRTPAATIQNPTHETKAGAEPKGSLNVLLLSGGGTLLGLLIAAGIAGVMIQRRERSKN